MAQLGRLFYNTSCITASRLFTKHPPIFLRHKNRKHTKHSLFQGHFPQKLQGCAFATEQIVANMYLKKN